MSADGSREPWWKNRFTSNAVFCNCSYTAQYPAGRGHLVVSPLPSEFCWMAHPHGQLPLALQKAASQQISFPTDSFSSMQEIASWQFWLAIYLREFHHLKGHGHTYTHSIGGEGYLHRVLNSIVTDNTSICFRKIMI